MTHLQRPVCVDCQWHIYRGLCAYY